MSIDPKVLSAKNDVEVKRAQLLHSVKFALGETKRRLAPDLIAEMAWVETKRAGSKVADKAVDFTKRKPVLVGGLAAAFGLFLARKPVGRLAVSGVEKLTGDDENRDEVEKRGALPRTSRTETATPSVDEFRDATTPIEDKKPRPVSKKPARTKQTETTK
ncbi:hypothetical protein WJT74_04485 [Sphingomicrobium sp. XHP0239]|uniref:hypothetical protein n=1 Tax=Sphingomicrobium maritimum TaxID=3133972 RepID=UPI0031CC664E